MKTRFSINLGCGLAALCLGAALTASAQQRGGFGGFPGFGGFGGQGGRTGASQQQQQQYTPNNQVGNATISIDDSGNLLVVGDADTIRQIKEVVAGLDVPRPQVLIKVVFLEVQHNSSLDIGIEGGWGRTFNGTNNPITAATANAFGASPLGSILSPTNLNQFGQQIGNFAPNPPGAGLYQVLGTDFQATLRAIATAGKAQLLSRPSILARDRQPAMIQVGQNVPLITSVNFTTFGGQYNGITYQPIGIILRVTPYVTPEGMVQMIISPETSALNTTIAVPVSAGVFAPAIDIRRADTVTITPNGQTVVIGGLMAADKASSESKIPFLGDIPILGHLFKRQTRSGRNTELLIFLTPHIVQAPTQLAALSDREEARSTIPKSLSEQELDRFLERVPLKKQK